MSAPDTMFFRFIGETVENSIAAFVEPAASGIIGAIGTTFILGMTAYISWMGYLTLSGYLPNPFFDVMKKCAWFAFIGAIALTAGNYMSWVVGGINGLQEGVAAAVSGGAPDSSIYETLDNSVNQAFQLVQTCMEKSRDAGITDIGNVIGWFTSGLIIALGALFFTLVGGAIIIVSKYALAVIFGVGPLFIACLMFPATARFFDAWFSQAMNYVFTIIVVIVFMTFALGVFDRFVSGADVTGTMDTSPLFPALQILGVSIILGWLVFQAGSIASGIAGGMAAAAMSLRQLASPVTTPAGAAAGVLTKTSNRLDPKTGHQTHSSRLEHFAMGRTIANPAYQRALFERAKEGWTRNTVKGK